MVQERVDSCVITFPSICVALQRTLLRRWAKAGMYFVAEGHRVFDSGTVLVPCRNSLQELCPSRAS
jgi:hypothetical protein